MSTHQTEAEILAATVRQLREQGYDVIVEPSPSLLPESLRGWRPDAIALGREPRLIVEVASESTGAAERIAGLQTALKAEPDWKLHLVLNRASGSPAIERVSDAEIDAFLDNALTVIGVDARAALLMTWAAFEALSRARRPTAFVRPQSPGRLIEQWASRGEIGPADAAFLRAMAEQRNRFIHGGLTQVVSEDDVRRFIDLLKEIRKPS